MGLLDRITGKASGAAPTAMSPLMLRGGETVEVVGESHYQDALDRICGGRCTDGHHRTVTVALMPEPTNPYDSNAVGVFVNSVKVGHLSRDDAAAYQPLLVHLARYNTFGACEGLIVGGWDRGGGDVGYYGIRLSLAPPENAHPDSPPPAARPSTQARRSGGSWTAASARHSTAGMVEGKHYTEWVDTVKDLKRLGQLDAAVDLIGRLCDAAEAESSDLNQTLAPWYFEQAAIIARKQKRQADEIAVLERYQRSPHAQPGQFDERLAKARTRMTD